MQLPTPFSFGNSDAIGIGAAIAMTSKSDGSERVYIIDAVSPVETTLRPANGDCSSSYVSTWALVSALMQSAARPCSVIGAA